MRKILQKTIKDTTLAIIAITAALGLLGVIAIESISMPQQLQRAEAKSPVGACAVLLKNSSATFCHTLR
jgi:hypothetical protein